jgi:cell division septum initiation protein DivIVA
MSDYLRMQEENRRLQGEVDRLNAELAEATKPKAAPVKEPETEHAQANKKR